MRLILKNYQTQHYQTAKKIAPLNLFHWLDSLPIFPKVYWKAKGQDIEIAAVGKIIEFDHPPIFDPANESTARFYGGKAFSKTEGLWHHFPHCIFFLPAFEIIQEKNQTTLLIHSLDSPSQQECSLLSEEKMNLFSAMARKDLPSFEQWEKLVSDFLQSKTTLGLEKIVLARQTSFQLSNPPAPFHLLSKLEQKNATLYGFQFAPTAAFIGATPEKLYHRKDRKIFSEAIAGTRPITVSGEELLKSEKDKREFQFVKDYIQTALSPLCRELAEGKNQLLATAGVQHLYCPFQGDLKETTTDAMLLDALHPTPAVNGTPKEAAFDYLNRVEPFHRGWYASALGTISQQEAEFSVGIRGALVEGSNIHLYAGGGLVNGSSAKDEWEEREHKIALFKKVLFV
ncbi:MAG TPA: isochorismate synthase [Rhabdochlamydiaceae bacterium]|nr:isochorismate synthase [Rhabdochlamydiaceae bacterium]